MQSPQNLYTVQNNNNMNVSKFEIDTYKNFDALMVQQKVFRHLGNGWDAPK